MKENVQPLKSRKEILDFLESLQMQTRYGDRNALLFRIGVNTGLRVGDIVQLRIEDVLDKEMIEVEEGKTKKRRSVYLGALQPSLDRKEGWLFPSQRGDGHISTTQVYRILRRAGELLGRSDIGTHTMRKTYGYFFYKDTRDIATLMNIFNHSNQQITLRYIGITKESLEETMRNFQVI